MSAEEHNCSVHQQVLKVPECKNPVRLQLVINWYVHKIIARVKTPSDALGNILQQCKHPFRQILQLSF